MLTKIITLFFWMFITTSIWIPYVPRQFAYYWLLALDAPWKLAMHITVLTSVYLMYNYLTKEPCQ